ncbi:MAG: hypothetical protein MZV64_43095 [Ignavibacteriales bacterium]|nr:hypothetical protein [Ignavibacteriales bacterium]
MGARQPGEQRHGALPAQRALRRGPGHGGKRAAGGGHRRTRPRVSDRKRRHGRVPYPDGRAAARCSSSPRTRPSGPSNPGSASSARAASSPAASPAGTVVGTTVDGGVKDYGDPDATHQFQQALRGDRRALVTWHAGDVCGIEAAAAQTACVVAMHESALEIARFPALLRRGLPDDRRARAAAGGRAAPVLSGVGAAERDGLPMGRGGPAGAPDVAVLLPRWRARRCRRSPAGAPRDLPRAGHPRAALRQACAGAPAGLGAARGPSGNARAGWPASARAFPDDLMAAPQLYRVPLPVVGSRYEKGLYIDEWGCRFHNVHGGVIGIVHEPVIADWSQLDAIPHAG